MNLQWILKQSNQLNPKKKKNEEKDYDMKYNQPAYNHTIEKKEKNHKLHKIIINENGILALINQNHESNLSHNVAVDGGESDLENKDSKRNIGSHGVGPEARRTRVHRKQSLRTLDSKA